MKKGIKKLYMGIFALVIAVSVFGGFSGMNTIKSEAKEYQIGDTDVDEPRTGNILIEVPGSSRRQDIQEAVDRINEIRWEACVNGYAYPNDNNGVQLDEKLTEDDYVEISYSLGLEIVAYMRAAEASLLKGHNRPNSRAGKASDMFKPYGSNGTMVWLENIAYYPDGGNTLLNAINSWYEEKEYYIENDYETEDGSTGVKYGHYQTLINPEITCFGMGLFNNPQTSYKEVIAGEFGHTKGEADLSVTYGINRSYNQLVEIDNKYITDLRITGEGIYVPGVSAQLKATVTTSLNDNYKAVVRKGLKWTSENPDIVSINEDTGEITAVSSGETKVYASVFYGTKEYKASMDIMVLQDGVSVDSIDQLSEITVENRVRPELPETVKIHFSNGTSVDANISWQDYDEKELNTYFVSNDFVITGYAFGNEISQRVHVKEVSNIHGYADIDPLVTDSGVEPVYPKAYFTIADLTYYDLEVRWDEASKNYYKTREGGTFTLNGLTINTFPSESGVNQRIPVSMTLKVNPATVSGVELMSDTVSTISGNEPVYPEVKVTWSNGEETYEDVTWDDTEAYRTGYITEEDTSYELTGRFYDYINGEYDDTSLDLTVNVIVNKPDHLEITGPDNLEYIEGQSLNLNGFTVLTVYKNGDKVNPNEEMATYTLSPYDANKVGEQVITVSQDGLTGTFTVNVIPKKVEKFQITEIPWQKKGQELNLKGVKATLTFNDGESEVYQLSDLISNGDAQIMGYSSEKTGVQSVLVYYYDKYTGSVEPTTFRVGASITVKEKFVDRIEISEFPAKLQYVEGQEIDLTGGKVHIFYDDLSDEEVNLTAAMISGYDSSVIGDQIITVTIDDKSDTFTVNVKEKKVVGRYYTAPQVTQYVEGQAFDFTGMILHTDYDDASSTEIDIRNSKADYMLLSKDTADVVDGEGLEALVKGYYQFTVVCDGNLVDCNTEEVDVIVRQMTEGQSSKLSAADILNDLPSDATASQIIKALAGNKIVIPCEGGDIEYTIKESDITGVEEIDISLVPEEERVSEENVIYKKLSVKLFEKDGEPVNTYVYLPLKQAKEDGGNDNPDGSDNPGGSDNPDGKNPSGKDDSSKDLVPKIGETVVVGSSKVKLTGAGSAAYIGPTNKKIKSITIPASVKIAGKTVKITSIEAGAFEKCTSLKSVVIPKTVNSIKKRAFYGCKKLKKITIKTAKLKKNSIGKKAFYGINKKAVIKVPKKKKKLYRKYLKKSGIKKSVKIK